jgi:hypothetical protein
MPGATEIKYMDERITRLPFKEYNGWITSDDADYESFDYSWEPNPYDPPYIYMWGNKHYGSELDSTISYVVLGATVVKHMSQDVKLTISKNWVFYQTVDKTKFDLTWRPHPTSQPYIYVWGNKHIAAELKPTIEYHVPGATTKKYMEELVDVLPELEKWKESPNLLTLAWSAKESVYKAVGKPGLSFQKEIKIGDFNQNPCKAHLVTGEEISLFWEEYPNFSLTVGLL